MRTSFRLGSLFGISIFVHFTWFIVFTLVTLSLVGRFAATFPGLPVAAQWLVGLAASLLFFGSVLFHELAHSLLAIRYGHPVRAITLFIFGASPKSRAKPRSRAPRSGWPWSGRSPVSFSPPSLARCGI